MIVIVGAGPVGLWLAAELRLGGAEVTVLEARQERDPHSKALTIHPRTLELLACRGLADRFLAEGRPIPDGHFGGLDQRMDFAPLDTPFPFTLALPQARTEELLEEHVKQSVRRGRRVTGLTEEPDRVRVHLDGPPYTIEADYVVGCDGARSTVREAAQIAFPGTDSTAWGWLGDVVLDQPPPGVINLSSTAGGLMVVPLPDGLHRIVGGDPGDPPSTFEEFRAKVVAIAGGDYGMRDPRWLSRFGNATRQAEHYRKGRVLLAGDAAHIHFPTGGVGLNVGVQDAMNLGWKLAAVATGRAPDALLDTYHDERHPVGAALLTGTQAQTALMTTFTPEGQALRAVLSDLIATVPAFSLALAEQVSALSVAYPSRRGHRLAGRRAPDLRLGDTSLFALLRHGRHVLLDLTGKATSVPDVTWHSAPLAVPHHEWDDVTAALIRPDGHVAWAGDDPAADLEAAVAVRWT